MTVWANSLKKNEVQLEEVQKRAVGLFKENA